MTLSSRRTLGLAAILCATSCMTTPAWADHDLTTPPPVFSSVDANGVDVMSGSFNRSVRELSIGPDGEGGLSYVRSFVGNGWTDNFNGTISTQVVIGVIEYVVSVGGASSTFVCNGSGCASVQSDGSTLVIDSTNYTYTTANGAEAVFPKAHTPETNMPNLLSRVSTLTYANGDRLNFTYKPANPCGGLRHRHASAVGCLKPRLSVEIRLRDQR